MGRRDRGRRKAFAVLNFLKIFMKKCYAGKYTESVVLRGALVCWGGLGCKPCKYLRDCIKQWQDDLKTRKYNSLVKKATRMANLK